MGCHGCELFPKPAEVLKTIADAMNHAGADTTEKKIKAIYKQLIDDVFLHSENPNPGHTQKVTTSNIWHLRERFLDSVEKQHGKSVADEAKDAIRKSITCYAAILHLNKGANILDREGLRGNQVKPRQVKAGYAPVFEEITSFGGRAATIAGKKDLLGTYNKKTSWKHRLPRMIFVSDMGDALSRVADFPFLKADLMPAIQSEDGERHLWLWLTKCPSIMAKFAEEIGGFPPNVCAMTTLTGPDRTSLKRLADLKKVKASIKGLSIEPLWERIPPEQLDLEGIDWVILGGESGSGNLTRPFKLEWVDEMRRHCEKSGVAFFLKQLGAKPTRDGELIRLKDGHGGDWAEWDESLRVREFPQAFHDHRKDEMIKSSSPRPVEKKSKGKSIGSSITKEEEVEFRQQHKIVVKGVQAFWDLGQALSVIKSGKLWRAAGHKSWNAYCQSVAGMSRAHAHRLIGAASFMETFKTSPIGDVFPVNEAQVRPLLQLPDPEKQVSAWGTAVEQAGGDQPSAKEVKTVVFDILHPDGLPEKPRSRSEQRIQLFSRLKEATRKKRSWKQVEEMLDELEALL